MPINTPKASSKARAKRIVKVDNGTALRQLIEAAGITQSRGLELVNQGQAFPIAQSTWKAYLAASDSVRRRPCPDNVLAHAQSVIRADDTA